MRELKIELANNMDVEQQKKVQDGDLNSWLPVTSDRNAKWYYSTFHNVTAMVGAGILGLPYAMSQLGWGPGVALIVISWMITLYTLWQLIQLHESVPGKRMDRYHELGQEAFGEKLGLWIIVPLQLMVDIGGNIVFMITGGKSLQKIHDVIRPDWGPTKLSYFTIIFGSVHLFLSHFPNLSSISGVSLAAATMSVSYSIITWGASLHKGITPNVSYDPRASTTTGRVFQFLSAMGSVSAAYTGHNVALEIQATISSPSQKAMWKGSLIAYIIVAICYFPVAFIGYACFGRDVQDNILMSLEKPSWIIIAANAFVVVHVIGSYQVFAMPVFDMLESFLVRKKSFKPTRMLRLVARTTYVASTILVAITFPFFGGILSLFGGLAFYPTTFYIPCMIWLELKTPKKYGASWCINWVIIVFGVLMTTLAPIGALRDMVIYKKTYKFFS